MPIYSAQFPKVHNPAAAQNLMGLGVVSDDGPKFVRRVTRAGSKLTRAGVPRSELPFWHPDYLPGEGDLDLRAARLSSSAAWAKLEALDADRAIRRPMARTLGLEGARTPPLENLDAMARERAGRRYAALARKWGWLLRELMNYDARERDVPERRRGARGKAKAIIEGRRPWPRELLKEKAIREDAWRFGEGHKPPWLDSTRSISKFNPADIRRGALEFKRGRK